MSTMTHTILRAEGFSCPSCVAKIEKALKRLPGVLQYTPLMFTFLLVVLLYFAVVQWLFRGRTVGKWAFGIKLCAKGGGRPKLWQCLVRTAVLHTGLLLVPVCGAYTSASATTFNGFKKARIVVWEEVQAELGLEKMQLAV